MPPRKFVNPYTFVRFPRELKRDAPPRHNPNKTEAATLYTGSFTVTWTLKTPLTLPARDDNASSTEWGSIGGEVRIPGSSIKGAVRSVHEALFAGCPRVVDLDYFPVYRELIHPGLLAGWRLGVVREVASGAPTQIQLASEQPNDLLYLEATHLHNAFGNNAGGWELTDPLPRSGDFIRPGAKVMTDRRWTSSAAPLEVRRYDRGQSPNWGQLVADGFHVMLITDTAARTVQSPAARCYWASAPLTTEVAEVVSSAWVEFRHNAKGARDHNTSGVFAQTFWPPKDNPDAVQHLGQPQAVGLRRLVDGSALVGDVVWVQVNGLNRVTRIKTAAAWRESNPSDTLRDRLGGITPCTDPNSLCLTCTIFGSADDAGEVTGKGRQRSYAGHVRFGAAIADHARGTRGVVLAPMGIPHPGAGLFYLESRKPGERQHDGRNPDESGRWGSSLDTASGARKPRQTRGRKFYWHADPDAQPQTPGGLRRYQRREHQQEKTATKRDLVDAGQSFVQTVTFDGLSDVALQTLLASFEPWRCLGEGEFGLHLGGGKPLGLGSVLAEISGLVATRTADRYTEGAEQLGDTLRHRSFDLAAAIGRVGPLNTIHQEARQVLALDGLGDWRRYVSYPTVLGWEYFGAERFDESYAWFQTHAGQWYTERNRQTGKNDWRTRPWNPLPVPGDGSDQTLPIEDLT